MPPGQEVGQALLGSSTSTENPLQDDQVQLTAFEQQNKKRLIVRDQAIDEAIDQELSNYVKEEDEIRS